MLSAWFGVFLQPETASAAVGPMRRGSPTRFAGTAASLCRCASPRRRHSRFRLVAKRMKAGLPRGVKISYAKCCDYAVSSKPKKRCERRCEGESRGAACAAECLRCMSSGGHGSGVGLAWVWHESDMGRTVAPQRLRRQAAGATARERAVAPACLRRREADDICDNNDSPPRNIYVRNVNVMLMIMRITLTSRAYTFKIYMSLLSLLS